MLRSRECERGPAPRREKELSLLLLLQAVGAALGGERPAEGGGGGGGGAESRRCGCTEKAGRLTRLCGSAGVTVGVGRSLAGARDCWGQGVVAVLVVVEAAGVVGIAVVAVAAEEKKPAEIAGQHGECPLRVCATAPGTCDSPPCC